MTALQDKSILAIDDAAAIRTFLRISMQAHGAKFHEAGTAADGLTLARAVNPDIVVLDLGLPDGDGLDILSQLKGDGSTKQPIVIILSVRKEQETMDKAERLGADAYLTKPFLMDNLLDIIQNIK
jgi:DNA-binding response OmpR family regulator